MSWDRELERGLPDCRLSGATRGRQTVRRARMLWERVFCANCGCDGGLVTADWSPHVFYVCGPCAARLGSPPPELKPADESALRGRAAG